jgi:hypothetical protein
MKMKNIPTKPELEKRLNALRNEFNFADEGGKERITRSIRLIETALLELASHEQSELARKSEEQKEAQKEHARLLIQEAARRGQKLVDNIAELIGSFAGYRAALAGAIEAWPALKNAGHATLLNDRELLKAIATELHQAGLKLPQGVNTAEQKSLNDKVRLTERTLLGVIDGFSSLYELAAEMEPVR